MGGLEGKFPYETKHCPNLYLAEQAKRRQNTEVLRARPRLYFIKAVDFKVIYWNLVNWEDSPSLNCFDLKMDLLGGRWNVCVRKVEPSIGRSLCRGKHCPRASLVGGKKWFPGHLPAWGQGIQNGVKISKCQKFQWNDIDIAIQKSFSFQLCVCHCQPNEAFC